MKALFLQFLRTLRQSAQDLLPIVLVIGFFQLVVLRQPVPQMGQIFAGSIMVLMGLTLFIQGLKMALFPLGEEMAYNFVKRGNLWLLLLVTCFLALVLVLKASLCLLFARAGSLAFPLVAYFLLLVVVALPLPFF